MASLPRAPVWSRCEPGEFPDREAENFLVELREIVARSRILPRAEFGMFAASAGARP
jgi:hypothetical protein